MKNCGLVLKQDDNDCMENEAEIFKLESGQTKMWKETVDVVIKI